MKTEELIEWLNEVNKYYVGDKVPKERIDEIIKRLEWSITQGYDLLPNRGK